MTIETEALKVITTTKNSSRNSNNNSNNNDSNNKKTITSMSTTRTKETLTTSTIKIPRILTTTITRETS